MLSSNQTYVQKGDATMDKETLIQYLIIMLERMDYEDVMSLYTIAQHLS